MKVTIEFPLKAKKHILTQRDRLRPEIVRDLSLLIARRYNMVGSAYDSAIEEPQIPLRIEIAETPDDWE